MSRGGRGGGRGGRGGKANQNLPSMGAITFGDLGAMSKEQNALYPVSLHALVLPAPRARLSSTCLQPIEKMPRIVAPSERERAAAQHQLEMLASMKTSPYWPREDEKKTGVGECSCGGARQAQQQYRSERGKREETSCRADSEHSRARPRARFGLLPLPSLASVVVRIADSSTHRAAALLRPLPARGAEHTEPQQRAPAEGDVPCGRVEELHGGRGATREGQG
jgi:hypothetical protein